MMITMMIIIIIIIITVGQDLTAGVRCGAEASRSPLPMVSLGLFKDLILSAALWPWVQLSL
jgi:hypothetical protein